MNNLKDTVTVLQAVKDGKGPDDVGVGTFHNNKRKAFEIVQTGNTALVVGQKTVSFIDNIKYLNSEMVTVDIHAYSIYNGQVTSAKKITPKEYNKVAESYRKAAKIAGITPSEMQAITWHTYRRMIKVRQWTNEYTEQLENGRVAA